MTQAAKRPAYTLADAACGAERALPDTGLVAAAARLADQQRGRPAAGAKRTLVNAAREQAGRASDDR
jgi:hypothetical protein